MFELIDTAGLRRKGRVFEAVEKFSVVKTLQAIESANVVFLLLDATQGVTNQDAHIANFIHETGLCDFESDKSAWVAKDTPRTEAAGNGAIMRLAPVVLAAFKHRSEKDILAMVRLSARETHYSFEAEAGAEVFAALLIQAMKVNGNKTKVADIDSLSTGNLFDDIWRRVRQPQELNTSGYIIHSLQVAWWAFQTYDSFRDGMLAVVNP